MEPKCEAWCVVRRAASSPGAAVRVWGADATVYPATADESGSYRVTGLPPGEYRIYAWEEPDPALTIDAGMRNAFGGYSSSVKLAERSKETADLRSSSLARPSNPSSPKSDSLPGFAILKFSGGV